MDSERDVDAFEDANSSEFQKEQQISTRCPHPIENTLKIGTLAECIRVGVRKVS